MDFDSHAAGEALAKWVPMLPRLIERSSEAMGHLTESMEIEANNLVVLLLAQAGRRLSLPMVDIPEPNLDYALQSVQSFGRRDWNGWSLCEPGGGYATYVAEADEAICLRMPHGNGATVYPLGDLDDSPKCAVALRLWAGAVAYLAAYEQHPNPESLERANWWRTKAGMAYELVKGPDWAALAEQCLAHTKDYYAERMGLAGINHTEPMRALAHQAFHELESLEEGGVPVPFVVLPTSHNDTTPYALAIALPSVLLHSCGAHRADLMGVLLPCVLVKQAASKDMMASWLGQFAIAEVERIGETSGYSVFNIFADAELSAYITSHLPMPHGIYPLGRAATF